MYNKNQDNKNKKYILMDKIMMPVIQSMYVSNFYGTRKCYNQVKENHTYSSFMVSMRNA